MKSFSAVTKIGVGIVGIVALTVGCAPAAEDEDAESGSGAATAGPPPAESALALTESKPFYGTLQPGTTTLTITVRPNRIARVNLDERGRSDEWAKIKVTYAGSTRPSAPTVWIYNDSGAERVYTLALENSSNAGRPCVVEISPFEPGRESLGTEGPLVCSTHPDDFRCMAPPFGIRPCLVGKACMVWKPMVESGRCVAGSKDVQLDGTARVGLCTK